MDQTFFCRLFYHLVANDKIATKILSEFNKQKLSGDANFIPLNRIEGHEAYEVPQTQDARKLLDHLQYEDRFAKAMKHIFGKV